MQARSAHPGLEWGVMGLNLRGSVTMVGFGWGSLQRIRASWRKALSTDNQDAQVLSQIPMADVKVGIDVE